MPSRPTAWLLEDHEARLNQEGHEEHEEIPYVRDFVHFVTFVVNNRLRALDGTVLQ
jgi:hypothetical protein